MPETAQSRRAARQGMEADMLAVVGPALRRVIAETLALNELPQPARASTELERLGLVAAASPEGLRRLITGWNREVKRKIQPAFIAAFKRAMGYTLNANDLDIRLGPNVRDARASEWFKTVEPRLKDVGQNLYDEATTVLRTALDEGLGSYAAGLKVAHTLGVSENRGVVIARTESTGALNAADLSVAEELEAEGFTARREWLSTQDTRTRPTHDDANGQLVDVDEPFNVGGSSLMFPGDPAGPPDETINCRCVTLLHIDD